MTDLQDLRLDGQTAVRPARRWSMFIVLVILIAVTGAGLAWWLLRPSLPVSPKPFAEKLPTSSASSPAPSGLFTAAGYIEIIPPGPWLVTAQVPGMVQEIRVSEGQTVATGDVVAILDDRPYALDEAIAAAAVDVASARLQRLIAGFRTEEITQAEAALALAHARMVQAQAQRQRQERQLPEGTTTIREVEAALADAMVAESAVRSEEAELALRQGGTRPEDIAIARAEVAHARGALESAQWRRKACRLMTPRAGVVLNLLVQPGEWIAQDSNQSPPGAVLTIFDPLAVQVWVDVNQRDIGRVVVGQAVRLTTDAHPDRELPGMVASILPQANLQKNTVQVKIRITEPSSDLRPETSVRVSFLASAHQKGVAHEQQ